MEGQQVRGAESGRDEYHDIPNDNLGTPGKSKTGKVRQELPILFRAVRADGSRFGIGSFTEMAVQRKIRDLTGVVADKAVMITPNDVLIEFPLGSPVNEIARVLHDIEEWEDVPVETHCMLGDKKYMMKVCRDRVEYEERKLQMQADEARRREEEMDRNDQLRQLIEQVNEQAQMVGELQTQNQHLQGAAASGSMGSAPRIPSSLHTPTGAYGVPLTNSQDSFKEPMKSTKNPNLPTFSGELPTPKGEAEIDNYLFQIKLLRSSYTENAIRNAIVATVRGHAKIAIRAIGYDSSLSAMINQLEGRFMEKETTDILLQEFHQMMMGPKDKVHEFGGKLEYKFRLLQERCPGRYNMAQLKDRLFHGMTDKLRDSVRYLFTNPTVDFNQLLKAAMTCEIETTSRQATKAKAMQFSEGVSESSTNPEISSIRSQLEQMSTILKGANFNGSKESNKKKGNGYYKQKTDGRQGLKGPGTSAAGPFRKERPPVQCHQCMGWGHYARNCPNEFPVEGSVNWGNQNGEVAKQGGTLPQQGNATQTPTAAPTQEQPQTQSGQSRQQ